MAMNLSENTQKADSAEDESWAEEHPEELLHAAIKLKRRGMITRSGESLLRINHMRLLCGEGRRWDLFRFILRY
jgi:hypothetical protein